MEFRPVLLKVRSIKQSARSPIRVSKNTTALLVCCANGNERLTELHKRLLLIE